MSLLESYKDNHPSFESKLEIFPEAIQKQLSKKLTNESNKDNFLSTISEISFGELFTKLEIEVEYDKKFANNQKPDWFLSVGDSQAICEVYRLNRSNNDQIRSNLLREMTKGISYKIPSNIEYKPHKLEQLSHHQPNEITKKLKKYNDLISNDKLPYFICIDIHFLSGFEPSDFYEHFKSPGVDYGKFDDATNQFEHLNGNSTELGLFYDNPQLSGIITYYNCEFQILLNPLSKQLLYKEINTSLLNKLNEIKKNSR